MRRSGTTSAYAENTGQVSVVRKHTRNYLRVRGEYLPCLWVNAVALELPPRTRRIRFRYHAIGFHRGTTSAYAENTRHVAHYAGPSRNYLRVRGEY